MKLTTALCLLPRLRRFGAVFEVLHKDKLTTALCLLPRLRRYGAVFEVLHKEKLALIITIIINTKYKFNN